MCPRGGLRASRAGEVEDTGKRGMTDAVWSLGEHGGLWGAELPGRRGSWFAAARVKGRHGVGAFTGVVCSHLFLLCFL